MVLLCSSGLIQLSLRGEFKHASKVLEDGMYGLQQKQVRVLFDLSVRKSASEQNKFGRKRLGNRNRQLFIIQLHVK